MDVARDALPAYSGEHRVEVSALVPRLRGVGGDLVIRWEPGQASALDTAVIAEGFDVGNVTVQRKNAGGALEDVPYSVDFAFAFHAFHPAVPIHTE